jgi:hypothetical protein
MDGVLTMVLAAAYVIAIIAPNTGHQNFMIPALLDALILLLRLLLLHQQQQQQQLQPPQPQSSHVRMTQL